MTARILIVDDVLANARLLQAKLGAEYYQARTAASGAEALRLAESWQPDLILLDVMMPEMDGYEVCRRLKATERTLHIPVVMVTALSEPAERLRGLEAGADDFLTKPVDFDTLFARARSLVRLKRLLDEWRMRGETARALGLGGQASRPPSVEGAYALVVEDWEPNAEILRQGLLQEGIGAERVETAEKALALAQDAVFDLIVLSLSLREGDALQLASQLRATDRTREIPMLLIADPEQKSRMLRGLDLGANDWLVRPVEENELRARARNQIRRKFYQDQLRSDLGQALEMALTDPLTGFYNQRYLMRHLRGLLDSAPGGVVVMMIDVDHFKGINDRWGHLTGDKALQVIAATLRRRIRVFDSIARYGGEEFVVVLRGTTRGEALNAAERLRTAVAETPFEPEPGVRHPMTVSIGIACCDDHATTAEQLLAAADQALYQAKRRGRNRTELVAPADAKAT